MLTGCLFSRKAGEFETDSRTSATLWRCCVSFREASTSQRDDMSPYSNRDMYPLPCLSIACSKCEPYAIDITELGGQGGER
jgi:hypothetical protein